MQRSLFRDPFYRMLAVLLAIAVLRLWILPLGNSFWLDETLTVWTIRDGFTAIIPHAFISLQSIAFCMLEWPIAQISTSEVSLRLLSVLAAFGTIYIYYRIGLEVADREMGLSLAVLYLAIPSVAVQVPNARPYAWALFLHTSAIYWLLVWLRSGRWKHGVLWIVSATGAVHAQYLFAMALVIEILFVLWRILTHRSSVQLRGLVACVGWGITLLLPALPQAVQLFQQRKLLSYSELPHWSALCYAFMPVPIASAVIFVWVIEWICGRPLGWKADRPGRCVAGFASLLLFAPTILLFALSRISSVRLFETRYLLPTVPGLVILWGWLLQRVESVSFRRLTLVCILGNAILWVGGFSVIPDYRHEDWRSAVRALPASGILLLYPGLLETRRLDWLQVPERWAYFTAPVRAYRGGLSQVEAFVLPFEIGPKDQAYVERLVVSSLRYQEHITVLARGSAFGPSWATWITSRLAAGGFRKDRQSAFGLVELHAFSRDRAQADLKGNIIRALP